MRDQRVQGALRDLGVLKPEMERVDLQSRLEQQFSEFFGGVVSEWNPCYDNAGRCRYRWDEELGAHDVEVSLEGPLEAEGQRSAVSSEDAARAQVRGGAPERMNLRGVLDAVFEGPGVGGRRDVQPVRRLVASLVNRVARHTKHGMDAPRLGVHACARGKR